MYYGLNRHIENFGDIYDRRRNEYDDCDGVGEVIQKIRDNDPSWKSSPLVEQVDCVPIYEWDGKFYKDKASAEAGSTEEEIVTHTDTGRKVLSNEEKKKYPGSDMRKTNNGEFMTNEMHTSSNCQRPGLDSAYAWCGKKSTHNYIQMITGSGNIERVKGVVTQGRKNSDQWVTKFEVHVSRNGDSWKKMKNSSNQTEFTGNTDRSTKVKNYFNEVVEAKYIRFVTKAWHGYNSMRIGYIRDKSGAIDCKGGSGLLKTVVKADEPWFRFTFNEAKTKSPPNKEDAQYSQGTAASTKQCPPDGHVLVAQRGAITSGPNNIRVNDLKLLKNNNVYGLKGEMSNEVLTGCGSDATSSGWYSGSSGGSKKTWSACVKPNNKGLETGAPAYHTGDGGYRYMYRHWSGSDNKGYNRINDTTSYKDNTHSSNANNGVNYTVPSTDIKLVDYENVNVIRQACNRGPKMVLPTLSTEWVSTIPASTGGTSGWKGNIWNYSGGTEGWLDQAEKIKWTDGFKNKVYDLIKKKGIGSRKDVNEYLVEEKEGTNNNKDGDHHSWSDGSKGEGGHIGGSKAYHSIGYGSNNWRTSLSLSNSCAKYKQSTDFIPVGIKIQPRSGVLGQAPTEIRLVWNGDETTVTLGTFANANTIKTILIDPGLRKKTKYLDVYSRHGRDSRAVSFRINFLIGKIGGGYSQDKGHSVNNNNKRPVDCKDGAANLSGSSLVNNGSSSTSTSWLGWSACNKTCGSGSQSAQGTTTVTQPRKYTKVGPSHGGRNNCNDTSGPNKVDTKSTSRTQKCNTHACCWYKGAGWHTVGDEVHSRKWVAHVRDCYDYCKGRGGCKYFQIVGGVWCHTYRTGSSKGEMNGTGRQMTGCGNKGGQCKNGC